MLCPSLGKPIKHYIKKKKKNLICVSKTALWNIPSIHVILVKASQAVRHGSACVSAEAW